MYFLKRKHNIALDLFAGLLILLWSNSGFAGAEVAVIVNSNSPVGAQNLDEKAIADLYLRHIKTFPGGTEAMLVAHNDDTPLSEVFAQKYLKKNPAQFKSFWARMIFTGRGVPPKQLDSDEAIIKYVEETPNAIGYVDVLKVKGHVKVVFKQ